MGRQKLGWTGPKDLAFFIHWEGIAIVVGGIAIALLQFWDIPKTSALHWFVEDYRLGLVIFFTALVGLPPTIARGLDHLRSRREAGLAQVEVATVLHGIELRLMHLVSKLREAFGGAPSNTYQNHTLGDCREYFNSRTSRSIGHGETLATEVNFYSLTKSGSSISLERKLFTGDRHPLMRGTFSTARGATAEAKLLTRTIASGKVIFCRDVQDPEHAGPLHITNGSDRPYRTFLSIPVFRDKNSPDDERVIGMLSINSTHVDSLTASDASVLAVYAWALSVAFEADRHALRARPSSKTSELASTVTSNGMEV